MTPNVAGKAQMYVDGYFARPTVDTAIHPFYHSQGSWNKQLWLYKDARVDQLLDDARKTNDEASRKAIFEKFQAIVEETVPGIIAYSAAHVNGVSKKVEGFTKGSRGRVIVALSAKCCRVETEGERNADRVPERSADLECLTQRDHRFGCALLHEQ